MNTSIVNRHTACLYLVLVMLNWTQLQADEPADTAKKRPPNIVLILADDAGYSDFSFRGSEEISTPNLDKLCTQGIEFTQAYAPAPVCTPSRAGILTGRFPSTIGAENNLRSKLHKHHINCGLTTKCKTLAERLKAADYFPMPAKELALKANIPHRVQANGELVTEESIEYLTDQLTDQAIQYMDSSKDKPFFLLLSYTAVHSPYQAKQKDLDNHPHMQMPRKKIGAMVSNLDQNVGRVMEAIDKIGVAENTLLVFTNDNGGTNEMNNKPYRGHKGSLFEGGIRVPFVARMPGKIPAGAKYDSMVSLLDLHPTFLSVAGAEQPDQCDGVNLMEHIQSNQKPHEKLFFKFHSQSAIRKGDYKYYTSPKKKIDGLFNLANDPTESTNLVDKEPELAAQLRDELAQWRDQLPTQDW